MSRFRNVLVVALVAAGIEAAAAEAREPLVSVEPERGIPGQIVVVTGRGFCGSSGCGRIRIQLYSTVVAQGVPVSSGGSFARRIRIPAGAPTGDVGLIATQTLQNGSELQAFTSFEMTVRLRTQQPSKKQAREAQDTRRNGSDVPGPDRSSEPAPDQARGDRAVRPPGSPPANSGGAQAAGPRSDSSDGGGDRAVLAAAAAVALLLGTALALVVVTSRGRRPRRGRA